MTDPTPLDSDDLDQLRKRVQHEHLFLSHVMTATAVDLLDALAAERARADAAKAHARTGWDVHAEHVDRMNVLIAKLHGDAFFATQRADAVEGNLADLEAAVDRVRRRHPRGDEEGTFLAPGLWCPTCGRERADNGYGGCPDRAALADSGAGE